MDETANMNQSIEASLIKTEANDGETFGCAIMDETTNVNQSIEASLIKTEANDGETFGCAIMDETTNVNQSIEASLIKTEANDGETFGCAIMDETTNVNQSIEANLIKTEANDGETFDYTKAPNFTSEVFKIEISKLPKYFSYGECKKLLSKKLKLKPHKINIIPHSTRAYVTFKNELDKLDAMEALKSYTLKGKTLEIKNAKPKQDAMATKRSSKTSDFPQEKMPKWDDSLTNEEQLKNNVIPWWKMPYKDQLDEKHKSVCTSLTEIRKQMCAIKQLDLEVFRWFMELKNTCGLCCPTRSILPSPVTESYRNKCGFTIGKDFSGCPTVGFRLGKYRERVCQVEAATCLVHVPEQTKKIASCFTDYVRSSKYKVHDLVDHTGYWKQLVVRTTQNNTAMVTVTLCKQELTDLDLEAEQRSVTEHFQKHNVAVDTLLFQTVSTHKGFDSDGTSAITVTGEGVIYEKLFDLTFRISAEAFFQCNTLAAEVLYTCVKDMVLRKVVNLTEYSESEDISEDTVLLDVCCGTGTIGLSLAKFVWKVIGLDICKEAIDDANINAQLNGIENAKFHCGKAQELLPTLIKPYGSSNDVNLVAVVDPPRCGLHQKVIRTLRHCSSIKKLVYVSCSIDQAKNNFFDLCRPQSKRLTGLPFKPILAQPVDLFPHTKHCEVVVLFERIQSTASPVEPETNQNAASERETADSERGNSQPMAEEQTLRNEAVTDVECKQPESI